MEAATPASCERQRGIERGRDLEMGFQNLKSGRFFIERNREDESEGRGDRKSVV